MKTLKFNKISFTSIKLMLVTFFVLIATVGFSNNYENVKKELLFGSVYGVVLLPNGTPAIGAMIGITNINKYAVTGLNGEYTIEKIPFGKHKIDVVTIEAEPKEFQIDLKNAEHELKVKLDKSSTLMLDEIVVTSKSEGQKIKERGYTLSLVDTKKSTLTSLLSSELLARTSGIKLRQSGGMGSNIEFNINGLSGNSIRVFIDGIPIRNYGSSFSLSSIPPSMIDRIEVYKGVVPTHLSEDALGGAVNIVLKQVLTTNLSASYSTGSFNTHKADFNGNYRHEKSGFTVGGSAFYNYTDNNYEVWGDPIFVSDEVGNNTRVRVKRFHDSYQSAGVNGSVGFTRTKWADRLMLGVLFSDMKKDIQHGANMQVVYGNRKAEQRTQMANLQYVKKNIVKGLDVSAFGSYSYGVRKTIDTTATMFNWFGKPMLDNNGDEREWKEGGEAGRPTLAENLEQNIAGRLNLGYSFLPNHKISANFLHNNYTRDVEDPLLPEIEQGFLDTRYLTKNIIGIAYDAKLISDKLNVSVFYKNYMQDIKLADPVIVDGVLTSVDIKSSARGSGFGTALSYKLNSKFLFMLSGEKAIRLPDSGELLGNLSDNVEASYSLRPESSINLNLGVNVGEFVVANEHSFSGEINFFYRDINDLIQKALTNTTDDFYGYENLGKVLSKGFDLDIRYNWREMLYFTYNISNFNARFNLRYDENGVEYTYYEDRLRNAPYLTMNSSLRFVKDNIFLRGAQLSVEYNFGYVHEFYRNWSSLGGKNKAVIPTQLIHDIGIVYTFPKRQFSISFDVKNILNEQVFDNWALQKPGRMFFAKISYNLF